MQSEFMKGFSHRWIKSKLHQIELNLCSAGVRVCVCVCVQVWHDNWFGFDEYLGGQVYIAAKDVRDEPVELPLLGRDEVIRPGRLLVHLTTSHNLAAV